jgi:hypothetical protein
VGQELVVFAGYENVNPRSQMSQYNTNPPAILSPGQPEPNAPSPSRSFLRAGLAYRPRHQVAVKLDLQLALDGPVTSGDETTASRLGAAVAFMF